MTEINKSLASTAKGSLFVCDIDTAKCAFCPYGSDFVPGDRIMIYDEKTVFARKTRERIVQVEAVKVFRSTGRQITLDLLMISEAEAHKIAEDSELTVEILMDHRAGGDKFDAARPPVVVYFTAIE